MELNKIKAGERINLPLVDKIFSRGAWEPLVNLHSNAKLAP